MLNNNYLKPLFILIFASIFCRFAKAYPNVERPYDLNSSPPIKIEDGYLLLLNKKTKCIQFDLDFGEVDIARKKEKSIILFNYGNKPVIISKIFVSGKNKDLYSVKNLENTVLQSKDTKEISLTFVPESIGSFPASLFIKNDGLIPNTEFMAYGIGKKKSLLDIFSSINIFQNMHFTKKKEISSINCNQWINN